MPSQSPQYETDAPHDRHAPNTEGGIPFAHRLPLWLFLGMVLGLLLFFLVFRSYTQPRVAADTDSHSLAAEDVLTLQREQNQGLRDEIARLRSLLAEEPCVIRDRWAGPLDQTHVTPRYGNLGPLPESGTHEGQTTPPRSEGAASLPEGLAPLPGPPAAPPKSVAELMEQATVFVFTKFDSKYGTGSGFFVAPGIIATNQHVVQGPEALVLVGNKILGGMRQAEVLAVSTDENHDYALLRVSEATARLPYLQLAPQATRSERVSAWGYPGYISEIDPKLEAMFQGDRTAVPEVVYSEGSVNVVLDRTPPMILHSAGLSQGNSGGPLVNTQGIVVGINTLIKMADKSYSQANIALASQDLAQFMRAHGVEPSIAQDTPPSDKKSP